jgi:transcriptional antiterminator RfaH
LSSTLRRQGVETYYPRYLKASSHARRTSVTPAPFFPTLCFVAIDIATQRWRAIRSTLGFSSLVDGGTGPMPVADAVVAELLPNESTDGFIPGAVQLRLKPCDRVRLRDSLFSACDCSMV